MHSGSTLFGGCANFRELCPRAHEKLSVSGFHITKGKVITNMHVSSRDKKRNGIKKDGIKRYKRNLKKHGIQLFKPYRQKNLFFGFWHPYGRYISVEYSKVELGQKVTIAHLKQGSKPLLVLVEVCNELVDGYLLPSLKHGRTRRLKARLLFLLSQYIARIPSPACTNPLRLTLAVLHSTPSNIFLPVGSYNFTGQRKLFTHLYNSHVRLAHHSCSNPVSHLRTINLYRCMAFQIPAPLTTYPIVPIYAPLAALWLHTPLTVGHLEAWHQRDRGP